MKGWDYSAAGYYFVTICTKNRLPWFGEIREYQIILSDVGEIATTNLQRIPIINISVSLDAWIVMPNHVHVIIVLGEKEKIVETSHWDVSTETRHLQSGSLGSIVNQYKSVCTKQIRKTECTDFAWQARYYDHIIRNEKELDHIRAYILGNQINGKRMNIVQSNNAFV